MSCVPRRTCRVFQARHVVCSKQDISCVPSRTCRVCQAGHVVCSKQDISCVPSRTFHVFHAGHSLCSKPDILCVPSRTFRVFQPINCVCSISSYRHIISSYHNAIISACNHLIISSYCRHLQFEAPLLDEWSLPFLDSFESESNSNKSWDDRLNSLKSGMWFVLTNNPQNKIFWSQRMKCQESSETSFPEVWRPYVPCLRGKRPFKVCKQKFPWEKS